jgi:D-sedoheptulose 7-phosphate isomerase
MSAKSEGLEAGPGNRIAARTRLRSEANRVFFEAEAERLARCCHRMAERFARGGRLIAFGRSPQARSDVRHVAVEFVHPVIVGKRALPAIGLAAEGGDLRDQFLGVAEPEDIAIAFTGAERDVDAETAGALAAARKRGCLTLAFAPLGAEWEFPPPVDDPPVRQELVETLYHVLWELVHVFFEHRGLLTGREARSVHEAGGSSFLYPFLSESEQDLDSVIDDVRRSVLMKAEEVGALRERTLAESRDELIAAAAAMRDRLDAGGKALVFGNGGSATDATDFVADLRLPPPGSGWPSRRGLDLTEDPGILTAIANDIGVEEVFQRQLIAYAMPGDVAVAFSTSGGSPNVIEALAEGRRRELLTVAFVGYDGGRIVSEGLADYAILAPSQHIPRIQEAQASAYHVLRELIELNGGE